MKAMLIVIETDADYAQAKALTEKLIGSNNPKDATRIAAQAQLIEAYERNRWPRRTPRLIDILTYLMEQHGLCRADLAPLLGTPSRVSEVLSGKRELSMTMVQRLRVRFNISVDLMMPQSGPVGRPRKRLAA